jgi:hypothetical protein
MGERYLRLAWKDSGCVSLHPGGLSGAVRGALTFRESPTMKQFCEDTKFGVGQSVKIDPRAFRSSDPRINYFGVVVGFASKDKFGEQRYRVLRSGTGRVSFRNFSECLLSRMTFKEVLNFV